MDVRQRAAIRKQGFAKTALATALQKAGIDYRHVPLLGTQADLRKAWRNGDLPFSAYMASYREYVATQHSTLASVVELIASRRCCLMCVEADSSECHRSVLAEVIAERFESSLSVRHLCGGADDHCE